MTGPETPGARPSTPDEADAEASLETGATPPNVVPALTPVPDPPVGPVELETVRLESAETTPESPVARPTTSVVASGPEGHEDAGLPDAPDDRDDDPEPSGAVAEPAILHPAAPESVTPEAPEIPDAAVATPSGRPGTPWRRLMAACKPHMSRAQVLAAVLCAVLGFALVVQLRQTRQDEFANLRQSDLVRILDDVTRRSEDLDRERSSLLKTEFDLRSGTDSQRAALELAEQDAATQGILSGRLPAEGPGVEITIVEGDTKVSAARMFNVLEELRNAGAEVIEVNGIRMVTSSYFLDSRSGIVIDGIAASAPYRWAVIGDPLTLQPAMEIPGGALPTIRTNGGTATIEPRELIEVKAVREPDEPEFASPGGDAG
ncbi:DUF881 domain-containing protein [Sanguibacter sp. 25GB23B1]|uniref:DUF881 domain-containing protein n=1 Tax=unclassified Sanguibacter TaxID=2645534 RepID=UPI0032AF6518